jgi:cobalt-zinc-cadmium efflux system protein
MGAGHDHGVAALGEQHRGRLWLALAITISIMAVEIVGGLTTNSLSLLSDAAHMGTDALGIAMALAAIVSVRRAGSRPGRTFGLYRLEVVAALANTVLLFAVAVWVLIESIARFNDPPQVRSVPMLIVAVFGLAANLVSLQVLRAGAAHNINVRGAYLEVLGDLLGSAGVITAAGIIAATGWWYADPIVAIAVGAFILPRAARLGRDALRILLQTAPPHLDVTAIERDLRNVGGVADVHDLHIWTLTSGMDVASAHLTIRNDAELAAVLADARTQLQDEFGIRHATLQVEPVDAAAGCGSRTW